MFFRNNKRQQQQQQKFTVVNVYKIFRPGGNNFVFASNVAHSVTTFSFLRSNIGCHIKEMSNVSIGHCEYVQVCLLRENICCSTTQLNYFFPTLQIGQCGWNA